MYAEPRPGWTDDSNMGGIVSSKLVVVTSRISSISSSARIEEIVTVDLDLDQWLFGSRLAVPSLPSASTVEVPRERDFWSKAREKGIDKEMTREGEFLTSRSNNQT